MSRKQRPISTNKYAGKASEEKPNVEELLKTLDVLQSLSDLADDLSDYAKGKENEKEMEVSHPKVDGVSVNLEQNVEKIISVMKSMSLQDFAHALPIAGAVVLAAIAKQAGDKITEGYDLQPLLDRVCQQSGTVLSSYLADDSAFGDNYIRNHQEFALMGLHMFTAAIGSNQLLDETLKMQSAMRHPQPTETEEVTVDEVSAFVNSLFKD